jgi:hypothetical protein
MRWIGTIGWAASVGAGCLSASVAFAHDVRSSDGQPWPHEHSASPVAMQVIRNVTPTASDAMSCEEATWPDIPPHCLERGLERANETAPKKPAAVAAADKESRIRVTLNAKPISY